MKFSKWIILIWLTALKSMIRAENVTVAEIKSKNATVDYNQKLNPIIIYNPERNYEQPTLKDYQECHDLLTKCLSACDSRSNQNSCKAECPICPILIDENIVIQGINDTDYHPSLSLKPLQNTTQIIRLTNEIHNVVEHRNANITQNTLNSLHVHHHQTNGTRVGGKFGLGYNKHNQSCCIVVRPNKLCDMRGALTGEHCQQKRQRMCSDNCQARIMYSKRVLMCRNQQQSGSSLQCRRIFKYFPYQYNRRMNGYHYTRGRCQYSAFWPYVKCATHHLGHCHHCYRMPYGHILQHGLPVECMQCFSHNSYGPYYPSNDLQGYGGFGAFPTTYDEMISPNSFINENDFIDENDEVVSEILQSGGLDRLEDNNDNSNQHTFDSSENKSEELNSYESTHNNIDKDDDSSELENNEITTNLRKRRHTFVRSKYSRRYGH